MRAELLSRATTLLVASMIALTGSPLARAIDPAPARARASTASAGRWALAAAPSYAYLRLDGGAEPPGGGLRLEAQRLLGVEFGVQLAGFYTAQRLARAAPARGSDWRAVWGLTADAIYLLDRSRWVPRLEGGLGLIWTADGLGGRAAAAALHVGAGLDYAPRPWLGLGLALHYYGLLKRPLDLPHYVQLGPRLALRW